MLTNSSKKLLYFSVFSVLVTLFVFSANTLHAKKVLPRISASSSSKSIKTKPTKGVSITARLRSDRRALIVSFDKLTIAKSINYVLTYTTNGVSQGFEGSVSPSLPSPQSREIVFGTCSAGICRYDTNIKNAKFTVTTTLLNGKKVVKNYKIKI